MTGRRIRHVAIVNRKFAEHYFKGRSAVGKRLGLRRRTELEADDRDHRRGRRLRSTKGRAKASAGRSSWPNYGKGSAWSTTCGRMAASSATYNQIRNEVRQLDPAMPVYGMKTLESQLDETLLTDRLIAMLSAGFGLLATLLASVGLYGVMAFVVARRKKELGIRLALGAQPGFVIWLVMREVLLLLAIGLAVGVPAALGLGRYVASQLYGIEPRDPAHCAGTVALLSVVSAAAGLIPAHRASRIDPILALRARVAATDFTDNNIFRSVISVKSVARSATLAVCALMQRRAVGRRRAREITFNRDVAPILFANCASCHRPGEVAPFSLLTYADAAKRANRIAEVTRERHMPPWLPDRGDVPIAGERRLRDDQIDLIAAMGQGGHAGRQRRRPAAPPAWPDGWQLGESRCGADAGSPVRARAHDGRRLSQPRHPCAAARRAPSCAPSSSGPTARPIHHAVIRVDTTQASRRRDGQDGKPGFDGMRWDNAQDPEGHFVGWAPGRGPIRLARRDAVAPRGAAPISSSSCTWCRRASRS